MERRPVAEGDAFPLGAARAAYTRTVQVCPACGEENPERFRLCGFCGTPLAPVAAPQDVRKTVTVVFSDLVGSTSLGERLDTETLREVLARYFEQMQKVLEHHGGTVEKFIGDAVMAVFGLPRVREDDALRAVRAAWEMKIALAALNEELDARWGVRLANRTGVNTGEVVAGDVTEAQRLVTGDTVNTAARLEQAAPTDQILLGSSTYRLVRTAVEVEAIEALTLKGKAEPVPAYRLLGVRRDAEGIARRLDLPIVGREEELASLRQAFDAAVATRTCRLVTLLGSAGVGKSRLIAEFLAGARDAAQIVRGRCLLYGEGITFWPLAEALRQAAGIEEEDDVVLARAKLAELDEDAAGAAERVAAVMGLSLEVFPLAETLWGVRRLLEAMARRRPLVVVFDDLHWAQPTFLDLVEHLVDAVEDAPILVVCASRHDLLDDHPTWGQDRPGVAFVSLEPLTAADSASVVQNLIGQAGLQQEALAKITEAAEGNPLFIEQMLSMLLDDGALVPAEDGRLVLAKGASAVAVPPTIFALLTARLDRLVAEERGVTERGSVIGQVFSRRGVAAISPEVADERVGPTLATLERKQFIRPDTSMGAGEAFRFHHVLIRDAAYQGLLKRARADLHQRFADWLELESGARSLEVEEILGYHLEQSCVYRKELGRLETEVLEIAVRGSQHLAAAGRRAYARGDTPAAANLLGRAAALLPNQDPKRLALLPDLGEVLLDLGEFAAADAYLGEAIEHAEAAGDRRLQAEAGLVRALVRSHLAPAGWMEVVIKEAQGAIAVLEEAGDHVALAKAWRVLATAYGTSGRYREAELAVERVIDHARAAGDRRQETRMLPSFAMSAMYGPMPVPEAIRRCEGLLGQAAGDRRAEALILCALTQLYAMDGDFDRSREAIARARSDLEEIGAKVMAAGTSLDAGMAELLADRPEVAERMIRRDYEELERLGERTLRSTMAGLLGLALFEQNRDEEAERFSRVAEEATDEDDHESQALWRRVRAKVLARAGRSSEAKALAGEAVWFARMTDAPVMLADALMDFAVVHTLSEDPEEASPLLREARLLCERKDNRAGAARAVAMLGDLGRLLSPEG